MGHDLGREVGRPVERHFLGFQRRRVLFEHQIGLPPALQFLEKRDEGADQHDPVAGADFGRVERIGAFQQLDAGQGRRRQASSASAFKVAMPTARRSPLSLTASRISAAAAARRDAGSRRRAP